MNFGNWFLGSALGNAGAGASQGMKDWNVYKDNQDEKQKEFDLRKQSSDRQAEEWDIKKLGLEGQSALDMHLQSAAKPAPVAPVPDASVPPSGDSSGPGWNPVPQVATPPLVSSPLPATTSGFFKSKLDEISKQQTDLKDYMEGEAEARGLTGAKKAAFLTPAGQHFRQLHETRNVLEEKLVGSEIAECQSDISTAMGLGQSGPDIVKSIKASGKSLSPATEQALSMTTPVTKKIGGVDVTGYNVPTGKGSPSFMPTGAAIALLGTRDMKAWEQTTQFFASLDSDYKKAIVTANRAAGTEANKLGLATLAGQALTKIQNADGDFKKANLSPTELAAYLLVPGAMGTLKTQQGAASKLSASDQSAANAVMKDISSAWLNPNASPEDKITAIKARAGGFLQAHPGVKPEDLNLKWVVDKGDPHTWNHWKDAEPDSGHFEPLEPGEPAGPSSWNPAPQGAGGSVPQAPSGGGPTVGSPSRLKDGTYTVGTSKVTVQGGIVRNVQ